MEYLNGGREKKIKRDNDKVIRPCNDWTQYVHVFLRYLHSNGFNKVPHPLGKDEKGNELVSFINGNVYNDMLPDYLRTEETLKRVAGLLKDYHDNSASYVELLNGDEKWMLLPVEPFEVMCHGDFAPYNVVFENDIPKAIIDFDTVHPGPRLWDISYALYRWVPLMNPENPESFGDVTDQKNRVEIFLDTYGMFYRENTVIENVIMRLESLLDYIFSESGNGNEDFKKNVDDGHHLSYIKDISYIKKYFR